MKVWSYILVYFNQVFADSNHRIDDFIIYAVFFCLCEENMDCDTCEQVGSNFLFKEKTLDTNMFKLKLPVRTVITHHLPQKAQGSFVQTPPPKKNASAK